MSPHASVGPRGRTARADPNAQRSGPLRTTQDVDLDLLPVSRVDVVEAPQDWDANDAGYLMLDLATSEGPLVASRALNDLLALRCRGEVPLCRREYVMATDDNESAADESLDAARRVAMLVEMEPTDRGGDFGFYRLCHPTFRIQRVPRNAGAVGVVE